MYRDVAVESIKQKLKLLKRPALNKEIPTRPCVLGQGAKK